MSLFECMIKYVVVSVQYREMDHAFASSSSCSASRVRTGPNVPSSSRRGQSLPDGAGVQLGNGDGVGGSLHTADALDGEE